MTLETEHYIAIGFLSIVLLPFILLLFPVDMDITYRIGWYCFNYFYVVLPLTYLVAFMLWRWKKKILSTITAVLGTSLTIYGFLLYLIALALISEY